MANTLSTYTLRDKYLKSTLQTQLRSNLVAEKVCKVERSDLKRIQNPYITQQTAAIQAVAADFGVEIGKVLRNPLEGLLEYHQ